MSSETQAPEAGGASAQDHLGWGLPVAEGIVEVASRAPSIHNTQPWRWVVTAHGVDLLADRSRQLTVADPDGHSLLISCGAALTATEYALRAAGFDVTVARMPDPDDPDLLARFEVVGLHEPSNVDQQRVATILHRQSDRKPFRPDQISADVIEQLRHAASGSEVYAHFPIRPDEQIDLAVAVSWADRVQRDDAAYIAEMTSWLRDNEVHTDGVPLTAIPNVEPGHPRHTDIPVRDFEVGVSGKELITQDVDEHPLIAVVLTESDSALDQLQAGESMMRLMVAADLLGVASCPLSQAVDLLAFRGRLQTLMGWQSYPQMMLRLGFPVEPPSAAARTPRRPVSSVLSVATAAG